MHESRTGPSVRAPSQLASRAARRGLRPSRGPTAAGAPLRDAVLPHPAVIRPEPRSRLDFVNVGFIALAHVMAVVAVVYLAAVRFSCAFS